MALAGEFLALGAATMIATGVAVAFVESSGCSAPYGRYARRGWGPMLEAKWAWMIQESPSALVPALLISRMSEDHLAAMPWTARLTAAAFIAHYAHRAFVYPLAAQNDKGVPVSVAAMAFVFCLCNALLQTSMYLFQWQAATPLWLWATGMLLWALGLAINVESDYHLIQLRRERGKGYHLPQGGLFKAVTCANYTGEILEWIGYAVACQHLAAWAFAAFTSCYLVPRALHHHHDYRNRFGAAAIAGRSAVIPFVL